MGLEEVPAVLTELEARRLYHVLGIALTELAAAPGAGLRVIPGGNGNPDGS